MDRNLVVRLSSGTSITSILVAHVALAALSIVAAVGFAMPHTIILGVPSLLVLLTRAQDPRFPPEIELTVSIVQARTFEHDLVTLDMRVLAPLDAPVVDVELTPSRFFAPTTHLRRVVGLSANTAQRFEFQVRAKDWGPKDIGFVTVESKDRFGATSRTVTYNFKRPLVSYIREESISTFIAPSAYRSLVGGHLSGERHEGCEMADTRQYQPGDRLRLLNWRISARHDEPWVTLRHPDRSLNIVLVIDASTESRSLTDVMKRSVQAAMSLARKHIDAQDPVGLLVTGNRMIWIPPDIGVRHLYSLDQALLCATDIDQRASARAIKAQDLVRVLPKNATLMVISPLQNDSMVNLATSIARSGHYLQVIEPYVHWPGYTEGKRRVVEEGSMASRMYQLHQEVIRRQLVEMGASISPWMPSEPLELALRRLRLHQKARRSLTR